MRDNETAGGEGVVPGEPADSLQPDGDAHGPDLWDMEGAPEDDCRGGPPCPPDGDTHVPDLWDMEGAPEDDCRGGPPCPPDGDADVPPVEPGGPVLVPGIFAGRLAGGEFTLVPVGPGGFEGGVTMTGGKWTLRTSIAAPGANM